MKFNRIYRDLSIRHKITFIYLPMALLPLLIFALISTNVYEESIIERTLATAQDNNQLIIRQIESYIEDAEDSATLLTININNATGELGTNSSKNSLELFNQISNELAYTQLIFPNIDSIAYLDLSGQLHVSHTSITGDTDLIMASDMIGALEQTTGTDLWFSMTKRDHLVLDPSTSVLTLGKKVINIYSGTTMGYLFINLNESKISETFWNQTTHYFIVDDANQIIASNDPNEILSLFNNHPLSKQTQVERSYQKVVDSSDNGKELVSVTDFNKGQWQLVGSADLAYLTKDLDEVNYYIMIMLVIIFFVIILSLNLLSSMLTRPLKDLTQDMKAVADGNLDVVHNYDSADEIGTLTKGFNHMSSEIKGLLLRVKEEQKKKQEYELALIQEQIKPHFLYNCLDAIYALSMMGRQKDAARTTKALADYYRLSLSGGHDIISIRDEISNVTNYLELQKIRYSDVFDYTIDVNQSIMNEKILKLTLQPIVENAIYHGLKPTEQMGHISLHSEVHDDCLFLIVHDNGKGIEQAVMNTLLTKPSKEKHFALYNVQDRIHLYFGLDYGISISSTLGEGTTITVKLPYIKEEAND